MAQPNPSTETLADVQLPTDLRFTRPARAGKP